MYCSKTAFSTSDANFLHLVNVDWHLRNISRIYLVSLENKEWEVEVTKQNKTAEKNEWWWKFTLPYGIVGMKTKKIYNKNWK